MFRIPHRFCNRSNSKHLLLPIVFHKWETTSLGHLSFSGFETDDTIEMTWESDGPANIRTQSDRSRTDGYCGTLPAAGSTSCPIQIPWIICPAIQFVIRLLTKT